MSLPRVVPIGLPEGNVQSEMLGESSGPDVSQRADEGQQRITTKEALGFLELFLYPGRPAHVFTVQCLVQSSR